VGGLTGAQQHHGKRQACGDIGGRDAVGAPQPSAPWPSRSASAASSWNHCSLVFGWVPDAAGERGGPSAQRSGIIAYSEQ
jgi:hypothetical protein